MSERSQNQSIAAETSRRPVFEVIDSRELASRLKVPASWVRHQTASDCEDPLPCLRLGKYVRFEWDSAALNQWLERRRRKP
jgi:hypothetical protein